MDDYPPEYHLVTTNIDATKTLDEVIEDLKDAKEYVWIITREGDNLIASCTELHLITSASSWESLELKIHEIYDGSLEDEND